MTYILIEEKGPGELGNEVSRYLKNNWNLYGQHHVHVNSNGTEYYTQALTKQE